MTSVAKGAALIYAGRTVATAGGEIVCEGIQKIGGSIVDYLYPEIPHSSGDHLHCKCEKCKFRRYYFSLTEEERQGESKRCPHDEDVYSVQGRVKLHCEECDHCKHASLLPGQPSGKFTVDGHVVWNFDREVMRGSPRPVPASPRSDASPSCRATRVAQDLLLLLRCPWKATTSRNEKETLSVQ